MIPIGIIVASIVGLYHFYSLVRANSWAPPFHSVDLRPVQVTLQSRGAAGSITFDVPRAWIVLSDNQNTKEFDEVPDRITTTGVTFELADPDATPLTIKRGQLARHDPTGMELRRAEYLVRLWWTDPLVTMEQWAGPRRLTERDGIDYDESRGGQYLLRPVPGEIAEAACNGWASSVSFCAYFVRIGPELYATLSFLDFRINGGPEFAIKRIRGIVLALCRQPGLTCSASWATPGVPKT